MDQSENTSFIDTTLDIKSAFANILAIVSDGILVIGMDHSVRLVNPYAEKLLGVGSRDVIGLPIDGLFTLEDDKESVIPEQNTPWKIALSTKSGLGKTMYTLVRKSGVKIPVSLSVSPILKPDKSDIDGVIIAVEDKAMETEVERMKNEFIPFAAHQLRTPLSSMRWNTEIILSGRLGSVPSYLMGTVISLYDDIHQMIRLNNDLLNLTRIDEGKIPNDPVDIDVATVVRSAINELQLLVEKRKLRLEVAISDSLPRLHLDAGRFRDVVQNIISNAIKFNIPGGRVTISVSSQEGHIEILVKDTGLGIPGDEQKHIFEKFFRAKNVVANQIEGTGLGLYVIKYYIDQWGGTITVDSEENKGTTVRIILPVIAKAMKH